MSATRIRSFTIPRLALALVPLVALLPVGDEASASDATIKPARKIVLFDGRDLDAFDTWLVGSGGEDPKGVFTVLADVDGAPAIRVSGDGLGGLLTKESYAEYRLTVEYRWGEKTWGAREKAARDSGVLLHCQGAPGNFTKDFAAPWMQSLELQIIEGGVGDLLLLAGWDRDGNQLETKVRARVGLDRDQEMVFAPERALSEISCEQSARRVNWWGRDPDWADSLGYRGALDLDRKDGWTRVEAICAGGDVRFFVDGVLSCEAVDSNLRGGRILLQSEGAEIFFRRVELGPLESPASVSAEATPKARVFRAGAAAIDVSPRRLPIRVNGNIREALASEIRDPLYARSLVLDDGRREVAICVVDSCMMSREMLDQAKAIASRATGMPLTSMLISATHTHTAPAAVGCHGTDVEPEYRDFLRDRIADSITQAHERRIAARVGWGVGRCPEYVFCRRWIMADGKARTEPFTGHARDVAQMNPGYEGASKIRKTGVVDPEVMVFSVQTASGTPLALLASYSTHYAGSAQVSADYFGEFARIMARVVGAESSEGPFVAMIANGTSGDVNCYDFTLPARRKFDLVDCARAVADAASLALGTIKYFEWLPLDMVEERLTLAVRVPGPEELRAAKAYFNQHVQDRPVANIAENYARETILLASLPPTRELRLQALRVGDFGITAIPCEVFGITGLTIKGLSPFPVTMNISLANGAEGYIPPALQFALGGYTTWRARTSCLETGAEEKIRLAALAALARLARLPVP